MTLLPGDYRLRLAKETLFVRTYAGSHFFVTFYMSLFLPLFLDPKPQYVRTSDTRDNAVREAYDSA